MNMSHQTSWSLILVCYGIIGIVVVESACSSSCSSCIDDKCERCLDGTYLDNTGGCLTCPDRCTLCYDADYCYNCTAGYFGKTCTQPCTSQYCVNNKCDIDNGCCISGCTEGYYQVGVDCHPCYSNCKTCVNFNNNCTQCEDGYYGVGCQYNCSHCKYGLCSKDSCTNGCGDGFYQVPDTCNPCNTRCTICSTFENCTTCKDGYWGPGCQFTCIDCISCNKDNSTCGTHTTSSKDATEEHTTETPSNPSSESSMTTTEEQTETGPSSESSSTGTEELTGGTDDDDMIIIYAAAGGGGLLVIIIVIVVVCKRKGKQSDNNHDNISMTQNENYVSADDIDVNVTRGNVIGPGINNTVVEDNDNLYSLPNKTDHTSKAIMESSPVPDRSASEYKVPPAIPSKQYVYID